MSLLTDFDPVQARIEALPSLDALRVVLPTLAACTICQQSPVAARSLRFAAKFLSDPDEGVRLAALEQAESLGYAGVPGRVYGAIVWSSGSMVDPRVSVLDAPPGLSAKASASAVLAALAEEPNEERQLSLLGELAARLTS